MELLLTGRVITAQEAMEYGLVEYIFPDATFLEDVLKMANTIASYSGLVTAATKKCVNVGFKRRDRGWTWLWKVT